MPLLMVDAKSIANVKTIYKCNCASAFVFAVTVFILINFVVGNFANFDRGPNSIDLSSSERELNIVGKIASWWLAKAYFANSQPPDVVILGSSQLGALEGADADICNRSVDITGNHRSYVLETDLQRLLGGQWKVLIAALPGMMISDQLLVSYALFSNQYKPQLVAVTFTPRDFIDNTCDAINQTEPFKFFGKHANLGSNTKLFRIKPKPGICYLTSILPLRNISEDLRPDFNYSLSQRSALIAMANPCERIIPGQINLSRGNYGNVFHDNAAEYKRRYQNAFSPKLQTQLHCLDLLLSYLAQHNIRAVAFNLPLTVNNKKLLPNSFWKYYEEQISEICKKNETDYISVDRVVLPFGDNEFIDGVHLNLAGGHRLSKVIAVYGANRFRRKTYQELLAICDKCLL